MSLIKGFVTKKGAIHDATKANRAYNPNKQVKHDSQLKLRVRKHLKSTEPTKPTLKTDAVQPEVKSSIKVEPKDGKISFLSKKYKGIDEATFNNIIKADPTTKLYDDGNIKKVGQYSDWLMREHGKLNDADKSRFNEDLPAITESLKIYTEYNKNISTELRNIDNLSITKLHSIALGLEKFKRADQARLAGDKNKLNDITSKITPLLQTENAEVMIPNSEDASKYLDGYEYKGEPTKWCTGAKENNMHDHYSEQGSLYVISTKNEQGKWQKHQLHFESNQFKDAADRELTVGERNDFFNKHPDVKSSIFSDLTKRYLDKGEYASFTRYADKLGIDFSQSLDTNSIKNRDKVLADIDESYKDYLKQGNAYRNVNTPTYLKLYSILGKDKMKADPSTNVGGVKPDISMDIDKVFSDSAKYMGQSFQTNENLQKHFDNMNLAINISNEINPEYLAKNKDNHLKLLTKAESYLSHERVLTVKGFTDYVNSLQKLDPNVLKPKEETPEQKENSDALLKMMGLDSIKKDDHPIPDYHQELYDEGLCIAERRLREIPLFMSTMKSLPYGQEYLKQKETKDNLNYSLYYNIKHQATIGSYDDNESTVELYRNFARDNADIYGKSYQVDVDAKIRSVLSQDEMGKKTLAVEHLSAMKLSTILDLIGTKDKAGNITGINTGSRENKNILDNINGQFRYSSNPFTKGFGENGILLNKHAMELLPYLVTAMKYPNNESSDLISSYDKGNGLQKYIDTIDDKRLGGLNGYLQDNGLIKSPKTRRELALDLIDNEEMRFALLSNAKSPYNDYKNTLFNQMSIQKAESLRDEMMKSLDVDPNSKDFVMDYDKAFSGNENMTLEQLISLDDSNDPRSLNINKSLYDTIAYTEYDQKKFNHNDLLSFSIPFTRLLNPLKSIFSDTNMKKIKFGTPEDIASVNTTGTMAQTNDTDNRIRKRLNMQVS